MQYCNMTIRSVQALQFLERKNAVSQNPPRAKWNANQNQNGGGNDDPESGKETER